MMQCSTLAYLHINAHFISVAKAYYVMRKADEEILSRSRFAFRNKSGFCHLRKTYGRILPAGIGWINFHYFLAFTILPDNFPAVLKPDK